MNDLSKKALIVLDILKRLGATDEEHKTHIYEILDKLEETDFKEILPDEEDYELECIECEMTQKSVSTILASLVRKGYVAKRQSKNHDGKFGNEMKSIRSYYLTNKQD